MKIPKEEPGAGWDALREYGEEARDIVKRNVGEARFQQICRRLKLTEADRRVLEELLASWRPGYDLDHVVKLSEEHQDYSNISRVIMAWAQITKEAAEVSTRRRFHEFGENN